MEKIVSAGTVDINGACEMTGLGRTTLYSMMERGELPYCKVGKRRLVPRNAIVRLLAENLIGGDAAAA